MGYGGSDCVVFSHGSGLAVARAQLCPFASRLHGCDRSLGAERTRRHCADYLRDDRDGGDLCSGNSRFWSALPAIRSPCLLGDGGDVRTGPAADDGNMAVDRPKKSEAVGNVWGVTRSPRRLSPALIPIPVGMERNGRTFLTVRVGNCVTRLPSLANGETSRAYAGPD